MRARTLDIEAIEALAGTTTVVPGPGWPGVLLHEAIGHGLESDFNRKGTSAFSGRLGERVASEYCTVIDDGTMAGRRGSLNIDDEGTPTQWHEADRKRRAAQLHAGQDERAADGARPINAYFTSGPPVTYFPQDVCSYYPLFDLRAAR